MLYITPNLVTMTLGLIDMDLSDMKMEHASKAFKQLRKGLVH